MTKHFKLMVLTIMIVCVGVFEESLAQHKNKDMRGGIADVSLAIQSKIDSSLPIGVGKSIVLHGIEFSNGGTSLTPASDAVLERALSMYQKNPSMEFEIRAYTDNMNDEERNIELTKSRAEAVKHWLVKRGIPVAKIKAQGCGSADPIATNLTPEGRVQNRRIEFFRTK